MPRLQLKWMALLAVCVSAVLASCGYLLERGLERRLIADRGDDLLRRAELVALWIEQKPWEAPGAAPQRDIHAVVREAARIASGRVSLIARDGTVIADSDVAPEQLSTLENHAGRPEVRAALDGRGTTSRRLSATVHRNLLYGAVPLPQSDGVVRVAVDLETLDAAVSALRREFMLAGGLGLAVALLLAFVMSDVLLRPIGMIRDRARALARGEPSPRLSRLGWATGDAFGEVAQAIDTMGEQLEARVAELTSEKEQLHAVLRGMVEGVLVVDSSGSIALANRRLRELFGLRGETDGRAPIEVIRNAEIQKALDSARGSSDPIVLEVEVLQPQRRVLRVHAVALKTRDGIGGLAVFHDMTEVRRLEAVRRDFVANASHELKTPLTAIRGFAETLVASAVPPEDRQRYLKIILNHAERIGTLIEDMLELSRVESSSGPIAECEPLQIGPLVQGTLRSLASMFSARGLEVSTGGLAVPPVRAESRALERVLHCLLDNAAKYTERGGKIGVRAEHVESGVVRMVVEDTGIGIPKAHQQRIFERFYRVDRARSREFGGTGLGLAIVRHWVERMGGQVGVESEPGRGSTFWFTLPTAD